MNRELARMCKDIINCDDIIIGKVKRAIDADGIPHMQIFGRPYKKDSFRCPICHRKCPKDGISTDTRLWRSLDAGRCFVDIISETHRIICPDHGKRVAEVPWAYSGSDFTKDFDRMAAFMACYLPKTVISELLRIDWKTVGRCVTRAINDIEPDRKARLYNLKRICVDETAYKKGYKYITIVVNADTNEVVWIGLGYGKSVFEQFCKELTEDQRNSIEVVAGDGASWIDDCMDYFPNAIRSVDPFHVVEWANNALDLVRTGAWNDARATLKALKKEEKQLVDKATNLNDASAPNSPAPKQKAKRSKVASDEAIQCLPENERNRLTELRLLITDATSTANDIKNSRYALCKNPDHLTSYQQNKLEWIQASDPKLAEAHRLKELLRTTIKLNDPVVVEATLLEWRAQCIQSAIEPFVDLSAKVIKHLDGILNFVSSGISSAKSEATNSKVKLIIRKAHGFRNLENMFDLIYLCCSSLVIPLPYQLSSSNRSRGFKNYTSPIPDIA